MIQIADLGLPGRSMMVLAMCVLCVRGGGGGGGKQHWDMESSYWQLKYVWLLDPIIHSHTIDLCLCL